MLLGFGVLGITQATPKMLRHLQGHTQLCTGDHVASGITLGLTAFKTRALIPARSPWPLILLFTFLQILFLKECEYLVFSHMQIFHIFKPLNWDIFNCWIFGWGGYIWWCLGAILGRVWRNHTVPRTQLR